MTVLSVKQRRLRVHFLQERAWCPASLCGVARSYWDDVSGEMVLPGREAGNAKNEAAGFRWRGAALGAARGWPPSALSGKRLHTRPTGSSRGDTETWV